jgi:hypothetical protein
MLKLLVSIQPLSVDSHDRDGARANEIREKACKKQEPVAFFPSRTA